MRLLALVSGRDRLHLAMPGSQVQLDTSARLWPGEHTIEDFLSLRNVSFIKPHHRGQLLETPQRDDSTARGSQGIKSRTDRAKML